MTKLPALVALITTGVIAVTALTLAIVGSAIDF
jgi:hypothetical protein